MARRRSLALLAVTTLAILHVASAASTSWLRQFTTDGTVRKGYDASRQQVVMLKLDRNSGAAGLNSKQQYLYGEFSFEMKLIRGNSAGTVSCFYVIKF
jgi:xyloglucan:xyloglucosyl transferase